jgi:Ca2+-binding RTX toxin-like protein
MSSQATPGVETRLNTSTTLFQSSPSTTVLADGSWVVTLSSYQQDGSGYGVYQLHYDADGDRVGGATRVNTYTSDDQSDSSMATLADGGWVVTWISDGQDGDSYGIYQQRFDDHGVKAGAETRVNTYTADNQWHSHTAALANGGWVVTWESHNQDGGGWGIYQQRYKANGSKLGAETQVDANTHYNSVETGVTALAHGGWVVSWSTTDENNNPTGIYQQRYGANGGKLGTETMVNTSTGLEYYPTSAALADGGWVVTWTHALGTSDPNTDVYQQRYDADGSKVGGQMMVNTTSSQREYFSSVTALADGGWVVAWSSTNIDFTASTVYEQRYDANGYAVGSETQVNTTTNNSLYVDSVVAFADGSWEVTWTSARQDGVTRDVMYQRHFAVDIDGSGRADRLTGSNWDETIYGRGGNDRLDGKGGNDVLIGGGGNDTYIVNSRLDDVQEQANQGTDKVLASVNFSLAGDQAVENMTLTGKKNIDATGNNSANVLTGNSGNNTINGLAGADRLDGGKGNDVLTGGTDSDRFVFKTGYGRDSITDFDAKGGDHDRLDLSGLKSIEGFADLKADHMVQHGTSVVIDGANGDTITLEHAKLGDLGASDFIF